MNTILGRNKLKILLLENIHQVAQQRLEECGYQVTMEDAALSENNLIEMIKDYHVLGIRSKTRLTEKFFDKSSHLLTVGAFCIGTDQVALQSANLRGIPVFNAPYSNTRSVAELVIGYLIGLARGLAERSQAAHKGKWIKSAKGSNEVRGKVLGIIGYGHIGSQLSVLAEALGLQVVFYDIVKKLPMGNARSVDSLADVLKISDFVSLHVPDTPETRNLIGKKELSTMRKGSYLINASRGTVVNISALAESLRSEHLSGAAVDVFPQEPESNKDIFETELQGLANVILTPHIGGSTQEAQENIGREVADSFIRFIQYGSTTGAVNFPTVDLVAHKNSVRLINVHKNVPGVLKNINEIVANVGANISAQYLATDSNIGYLVMDMEYAEADEAYKQIIKLETNIRTRILR